MSTSEGSSLNLVFRPIWVIRIEPIDFFEGSFHFYSEFLIFFLIFDLTWVDLLFFGMGGQIIVVKLS